MHELDITKNLIKQIKEIIISKKINKNMAINLEIGNLSTFSAMPIKFYFKNLLKEDDFFENKIIKLKIIKKKGIIYCNDCNTKTIIDRLDDIYCSKCYSLNTKIIDGKEVIIKKIELI
ncbi:MAG: hydrogenase/urease maturation nickel metallochaperone HypA [Nanoarchaeota archaeon]